MTRFIAFLPLAVAACGGGGSAPDAAPSPSPPPAAAPAAAAPDFGPTNDGENVRKNLDAEIAMYEKRQELESLVPRLAQRGMFYGRIADRERALALADRWAKEQPGPAAFGERAGLRSAFHRFDEALADLKHVPQGGESLRAQILEARGELEAALTLHEQQARLQPSVLTLGSLGVVLGELGRAEEADAKLREALKQHRNTSPLPVSWVQFQRALIWEAQGQPARARELYEDAVARLPGYAAATSHLAGLLAAQGDKARAISLLEGLVETSDDPEYLGQLGALKAEDELIARARTRYEELLSRHPEAYAAHAARFYLGAGKDPARAAALATKVKAHDLVAEARLAAGDAAGACKAAQAGLARPHASKQALTVYWRAFSACGDEKRAAEVDARLKKPSTGGR